MRRRAGMTLLEVLIAVTLLAVLSVGMMTAMRIGISALSRTDRKLMDNRRVAGAQRIVEQELQGLIPIVGPCNGGAGESKDRYVLFSGQSGSVTLISGFSLQQAWRGRPQLLQIFTTPDDQGGTRLVVNETPYGGPFGGGPICIPGDTDPETGGHIASFAAPSVGPATFVLADHLRAVRFEFLDAPKKPGEPGLWTATWNHGKWPFGIRIEMVPMEPSPARLQPITVIAPLYVNRVPGVKYEDR
jgi:general secretion pathway protein J